MKEIFKDVKGYEELYQISNFGRVKVKKPRYKNKSFLKSSVDGWGYLKVCLYKNKICKSVKIHRLVAIHFLNRKNEKLIVNHKNGIKTDNIVSNLEWCTYSENNKHAMRIGLAKSDIEHPKSKLTKSDIDYILKNFDFNDESNNIKAMCVKFNVRRKVISDLLNNKTYKKSNKKKFVTSKKISDEDKKYIRDNYSRYSKENSTIALSKKFNISPSSVSKIAKSSDFRITKKDSEWIKKNYKPRDQIFGNKSMAKKFKVSGRIISEIIKNKINECK